MQLDWKAWLALGVFVVQNGLSSLIMRYAKAYAGSVAVSSTVLVLVQEFVLKLPFCMILYSIECGGVLAACRAVVTDLRERPKEWLQLSVPAALYTIQNTMMYVGYANLEAAIGQVTYQSKILFTAVFSVLLLGKRLSQVQWLSLLVLSLGVLCVQGILDKLLLTPPLPQPSVGRALQETATELAFVGRLLAAKGSHGPVAETAKASHQQHHHSRGAHSTSHGAAAGTVGTFSPPLPSPVHAPAGPAPQNPTLGVAAFLIAALCTAFASVYFEKMLKGASKPSLWLRNIQLASYSTVIAFAYLLAQPGGLSPPDGLFAGFGAFAWLSALWQALGGILVAVTIKYSDNILRGFAQALAIIVGAVGSYFLFGFVLTPIFTLGCTLVISAVFMYAAKSQTPMELCGCGCSGVVAETEDSVLLPTSEKCREK